MAKAIVVLRSITELLKSCIRLPQLEIKKIVGITENTCQGIVLFISPDAVPWHFWVAGLCSARCRMSYSPA